MRFIKFVLLFFAVLFVLLFGLITLSSFLIPKIEEPISILILGKGGEGHTGPNLTDTVMVAYLNTNQSRTSIFSLPRDIWISDIRAKINTAYHYGGFKMAGDSVTTVTGIPINYSVIVDFSLFKDFVDSIGGIDITVDNTFIDEKYPIAGLENDLCNGDRLYKCRYETLTFVKGQQRMDGELALKFVRSRNAVGIEGTDIAREKRQQKVINAIKEKILSPSVAFNPQKIKLIYDVFTSHIETNIDRRTALSLGRFMIESKFSTNFLSVPEDLLMISQNDKKYDKQYVFIPKSGSWKELQEWVKNSI